MTVLRVPNPKLPWSSSYAEDSRFRKILTALLVIYIVFALIIALLKLPPVVHPEPKDLPPQLANVILQKVELPKPVVAPKPIEAEKPAEKPKPIERAQEKPKPKPVRPVTEPVPPSTRTSAPRAGAEGGKEAPIELMQQARAKAAKSGVLQFKDDLAEMRESVDVSKVTRSNLTRATGTAEKTERSIIAGKATGGSGGINTAALSTDTGGSALSGRETTRIDSAGGGLGGLSAEAGGRGRGEGSGIGSGTGKGSGKKGDLVSGSDVGGGRSDEAIRRVMDQQKGGIFAIYNRALRQDPTLQGKFVFEMVIEPDGEVSDVKLVSSELRDNDLVTKILARIRLINFGSANVLRTRVNYSLDFLPNA